MLVRVKFFEPEETSEAQYRLDSPFNHSSRYRYTNCDLYTRKYDGQRVLVPVGHEREILLDSNDRSERFYWGHDAEIVEYNVPDERRWQRDDFEECSVIDDRLLLLLRKNGFKMKCDLCIQIDREQKTHLA